MEGRKLQDRLYLASGKAARYAGLLAEAYRSTTSSDPLNPQNRFIKLPAVFLPPSGSINNTNTYGQPIWHGLFDGSYTRPGDYIVVGSSTYFIASQEPLMPILCVRTNRTISISRPNQQTLTAANSYGGYTLGASVIQISNFPACVLGENRSGASTTDLPSDQTVPFWYVLLPALIPVILSPGDLISDDLSRTAVIAGAELTNLGWRISAKMATT